MLRSCEGAGLRKAGRLMYESSGDNEHLYFKLANGLFARITRADFERAVNVARVSDCPKCRRKSADPPVVWGTGERSRTRNWGSLRGVSSRYTGRPLTKFRSSDAQARSWRGGRESA